MDSQRNDGKAIRPEMVRRACGGWLAVAPKNARVRLGVTAETEDEARELFRRSAERWAEILAAEQSAN